MSRTTIRQTSSFFRSGRGCWLLAVAVLLIGISPGWSQLRTDVSAVGTNAASFLEIGVGARAMAMGGAYVAIANDPTALYYNPAGMVWNENIQVELMHTRWLVGTNFEFLGVTLPVPLFRSSIGFSFLTLDYGEQPVRTVERPEGTGQTYSARDYAAGLSYALALTPHFSFGLTGKYINQRIWNESGGTFALDLGIFYNTPLRGLRLGMSMSNFGGEISLIGRDLDSTKDPDERNENVDFVPVTFKTSSFPLPVLFRAGLSYAMEMGELGTLTVSGDLSHPSHATESINFGVEYGYASMFYLRAGFENLFERDDLNVGTTGRFSLGGGIDYYRPGRMGIRVDYAFSDWGPLNSVHRFSIGLVFD
ncbi:MAG: hypothetical protein D6715_09035 [Calditrichaeota bacterium]|nr:MAG: hypothetical protein D6715_09035 [Calditrichota bacterium]